jgi:GAF domain-containing protein
VGRDSPDQVRLGQLADEQAALRRVATLVAQATPPEEVFAAVVEEVGQLFRVELATLVRYEPGRMATPVTTWGPASENLPVGIRWPLEGQNVSTLVFETGRPARIDRYADSSSGPFSVGPRETGIRSAVGTPVIVEGRLWGVIFVGSTLEQPLPAGTESRLALFTELVATAIANADSRAALARLAEEQAALRRVATLVARATPPREVFAAVAGEAGRLLGVDFAVLVRYDPQGTLEVVGTWTRTGAPAPTPVGGRLPLGGRNVTTLVHQTGRPARIDYSDVSGVIGQVASQDWRVRSSIGVPVRCRWPRSMAAWCCRSATTASAGPIPPAVRAWPALPTGSRPWAARSMSAALPGPGRTSRWSFHSSTSWLRMPADARPARVATRLTGRPDPLLAGSRIGCQPGRNKGSHAASWNSRELRVTHERCRPGLRLRPLRLLSRQVPGSPHAHGT